MTIAQLGRLRLHARILLLVAAPFAAGVALWLGARTFFRTTTIDVDPEVWSVALTAQERAQRLRAMPLRAPEDVLRAVEALLAALPERIPSDAAPEGAPRKTLRRPLTLVLEFLRVRGAGDADAYASWARSQGLSLAASVEAATQLPRSTLARWFFCATGQSLPDDIDPDRFFRLVYAANSAVSDGALRPVAVVTEAPAVEAALSSVSFTDDALYLDAASQYALRDDTLGEMFWSGGSTIMGRRLWRPDRSVEELAAQERSGRAQAALVRLVVEGVSGLRTPMSVALTHDRARDAWRIEALFLHNVGADPERRLMRAEPCLYVF